MFKADKHDPEIDSMVEGRALVCIVATVVVVEVEVVVKESVDCVDDCIVEGLRQLKDVDPIEKGKVCNGEEDEVDEEVVEVDKEEDTAEGNNEACVDDQQETLESAI